MALRSNEIPIISRLRQPRIRWAVTAALLLALLLLVAFQYQPEFRGFVENLLNQLRQAGPLLFFVAMAILPAFGFPLLPFALIAGPAFNPVLGPVNVTLLAVLAVAVNVTFSNLLSRIFLGPLIQRLLHRFGYKLPELPMPGSWQVVLAIRLAPGLPFWAQSYILGLLRIAWVPYLVISTIVPSLYLSGAIILGGATWQGNTPRLLMGAGILGFVACAASLWRNRKQHPAKAEPSSKIPCP